MRVLGSILKVFAGLGWILRYNWELAFMPAFVVIVVLQCSPYFVVAAAVLLVTATFSSRSYEVRNARSLRAFARDRDNAVQAIFCSIVAMEALWHEIFPQENEEKFPYATAFWILIVTTILKHIDPLTKPRSPT